MKTTLLFSVFLMASSVCGDPIRRFYVKVHDHYKPLSVVNTPELNYLALRDPKVAKPPTFVWDKGYALAGDASDSKYFGLSGDDIVLGKLPKVRPFKMNLNRDQKVENLHAHLCGYECGDYRGFLVNKNMASPFLKCIPVDIFFLSSLEAKLHSSRSSRRHKTEEEDDDKNCKAQ